MIKTKLKESEDKKTKKKVSQVISFRLPVNVYENYERKCIEGRITMTDIIRKAVLNYLN